MSRNLNNTDLQPVQTTIVLSHGQIHHVSERLQAMQGNLLIASFLKFAYVLEEETVQEKKAAEKQIHNKAICHEILSHK